MNNKKIWWKRLAVGAGVLFAIYVVVEIVLAGGGTPPLPPSQAPIDLRGGHVLNNHIATKSWSFDYDHARLSPDGMSGSVDGVRNGIVFRKGKPYLRISARHIRLDIQSLDFTAVGRSTSNASMTRRVVLSTPISLRGPTTQKCCGWIIQVTSAPAIKR